MAGTDRKIRLTLNCEVDCETFKNVLATATNKLHGNVVITVDNNNTYKLHIDDVALSAREGHVKIDGNMTCSK